MEAFLYCWTDRKYNKLYVGSHKGSINDGYVCSSKYMLEEYHKRTSDFTRQIVASGTHGDIRRLEKVILTSANAKNDPNFYNMHNADAEDFYLKRQTKESRIKISNSKLGIPRPDVSINNLKNNPNKGQCGRSMLGSLNPMYNKNHTRKSIDLISKNRKGKGKQPKSIETRIKMSEAAKLRWAK